MKKNVLNAELENVFGNETISNLSKLKGGNGGDCSPDDIQSCHAQDKVCPVFPGQCTTCNPFCGSLCLTHCVCP